MDWLSWLKWAIQDEIAHRRRTNAAMKEIRRNHYRAVGFCGLDKRSYTRYGR